MSIKKSIFTLLLSFALTSFARAAEEPPTFLTGGDISYLTRVEQTGGVFHDGGKPRDLLDIFKARGCNLMRLRLWVNPSGQGDQVNDLAHTIALAQRVKRAGFKLLLDLHYSDTWADPAHQRKPAAWRDLPFQQLKQRVFDYSRDTLIAFKQAGATPDMVQVGNEIANGMLWPDGHSTNFPNFATLLQAGIAGTQAGAAPESPQIMIHIETGGNRGATQSFFDKLKNQNVAFDVIGLSYYPQWHGPISQLEANLQNAARRYGKPIIVVETNYPWNGSKASTAYPTTPEGQRDYLQQIVKVVRATPNGLGRGVVWWAPEVIPTKTQSAWKEQITLFDDQGNALPALEALRP